MVGSAVICVVLTLAIGFLARTNLPTRKTYDNSHSYMIFVALIYIYAETSHSNYNYYLISFAYFCSFFYLFYGDGEYLRNFTLSSLSLLLSTQFIELSGQLLHDEGDLFQFFMAPFDQIVRDMIPNFNGLVRKQL